VKYPKRYYSLEESYSKNYLIQVVFEVFKSRILTYTNILTNTVIMMNMPENQKCPTIWRGGAPYQISSKFVKHFKGYVST
jgi:hypothetical protein